MNKVISRITHIVRSPHSWVAVVVGVLVFITGVGASVLALTILHGGRSTPTAQKESSLMSPHTTANPPLSSSQSKSPAAKSAAKPPTQPSSPKTDSSTSSDSHSTVSSTPTSNPASPAAPSPVTANSYRGAVLYIDPFLTNQGREAKIASQPIARWFGDWNTNVQSDVATVVGAATNQGKLPTLVTYNIPERDCGSYSAGGAASSGAYQTWIRQFAAGIGQHQAIVVLEPDALAGLDCLNAADQAARLANLSDAVNVLTSQTKAFVYIDAGNPGWQSAGTMASRLQSANVGSARGFSLNVSNFYYTADVAQYGTNIQQASASLMSKKFVIDTSRNGNGPTADHQWCNPAGRALGLPPTTTPSEAGVDAELWIKVPGQSDGTCGPTENGTNPPSAGTWWNAYAQMLIANASW